MNYKFKRVIQRLEDVSLKSVIFLAHLSIGLGPAAGTKVYQVMRTVYWLLPIKAERKRRWADRVVSRSRMLSARAINVRSTKAADTLANIPVTFSAQLRGCGSGAKKRALIIEHRLPTPDKTSASVRLAALIELIRGEGWDVIFISDTEKVNYHWVLENIERELPSYENMLTSVGVSYLYGFEHAVELLASEGPTFGLVILSYPEIMHKYAPLVRALAPLAHLVYDTVDLHSLRFRREAAMTDKETKCEQRAEYYERIERANFQIADTVVAISRDEAKQIISHCPRIREPIVIPNVHSVGRKVTLDEKRTGLIFIGHYPHTPNEDAVCYFVREILPSIKQQISDVEFVMLGSSITDKVRALGTKGIHAIGYVADPEPYFSKARVFVAPLRYGAGMKGKIGQALSFGVPIVSTSIGTEGMGLLNERHLLVADSAPAFAAAVVRLYRDDDLWQRISIAGQDHVRNSFSEVVVRPTVAALLTRATHAASE
jgi:glycosyltransferase involved in cell wall biosynthesis